MTDANISTFILGSLLAMVTFAVSVIWFLSQAQKKVVKAKIEQQAKEIQLQEKLLLNTVMTQEKERERIAKELHDDIGSKLNIIHLNLHLLQSKIKVDDSTNKILDQITGSLEASTKRTRSISHELMPVLLQKFGIDAAVSELANSLNLLGKFTIDIRDVQKLRKLTPFQQLNLYRIVQELTTNTIKYAGASYISLHVSEDEEGFLINYTDNGKGFDHKVVKEGLGLGNMQTRIKLLKGTLEYIDAERGGVHIRIKIPL